MTARPAPRVTAAMCAFGRVLAEPRLSPDGERLAFVSTAQGRAAIVVVDAAGGPELVITSEPPPRPAASYGGGAFDWTPDGGHVVYAGVDGGLWIVSSRGGAPRAIVDPPPGGAAAPTVSPDGSRVAYVVDQHHVAVATLDADGAWPVRLSSSADFCFDPAWSPDSALVAWCEWDVPFMPWDESRIVVRAAGASAPGVTVAGGSGVATQQPRFSPRGDRIAFLSDETGWRNLWTAALDGTDAKPVVDEPFEHGGPSWGLGERAFAWSPDGEQLAGTRNEAGFVHLRLIDVRTGEARPVAKGGHGGLSWVGDRLAAMRSGARTPTQVVVYEGAAAPPVTVVRGPLGGWEALDLPEPEVVSYDGDEGTTVHARLYRPASSATGTEPPPALVWIHGGPTSQWTVDFNARFAYFLDRGWAILVVDHRGSTGFGRAYQQALQGRWGEVDTADVAAAMRGAAAQGDVDGHRLVPIGGSAGGFTVLNLLAHHGDLCAAGVDLFGVADLFDLNETTHRFEAHYLHGIVGPLPAAADAYRSRSPITVAEQITAPLLILQGDNDNVVPPAQSQAIADRLTTLGRTVELHLYEGEGHGWNRPDVVVDELGRIESFLRRHVLEWRA